jgi:hypothetical protein
MSAHNQKIADDLLMSLGIKPKPQKLLLGQRVLFDYDSGWQEQNVWSAIIEGYPNHYDYTIRFDGVIVPTVHQVGYPGPWGQPVMNVHARNLKLRQPDANDYEKSQQWQLKVAGYHAIIAREKLFKDALIRVGMHERYRHIKVGDSASWSIERHKDRWSGTITSIDNDYNCTVALITGGTKTVHCYDLTGC